MHGIGNDFVMVNGFETMPAERELGGLAQAICDRRFGVGADGLIFALPGESAQFRMRMLNPDGSESEMCGNGIRCLAEFLVDEGLTTDASIPVETGAGLLVLERVSPGMVRVDMGIARLRPQELGMPDIARDTWIEQPISALGEEFLATAVSMGNPHAVLLVDDVECAPVAHLGPLLERHGRFPRRANVGFMQIVGPDHIRLRVFERGAGETLACGSGACAAVVAGRLWGLLWPNVRVALRGGELSVHWAGEGEPAIMTGPAEKVFEGWIES